MKKWIAFMAVLALVFSCAEEVVKKPEDMIPRDTMTDLLYEMAVLNAAKSTNKAILEEQFDDPTEFLFKQYGVDSLQFVKSDMYYASQPLVYEAIYKEVEARLEKEKKAFEEARQKRTDSLVSRSREIRDSLGLEED
ncbi:protein of unknown function [Muriicola jejuensis]|uniref:DUF4296 domain-containing protein n=1 Tax=Muriicola jejuensis TaxID=504488 RepID=A0A6P0UGG0_9FLAO|nr:DUF4296 domain-containing protein [Muriicola jejuensis]NER10293.1 DUF4296 domain-containing protein [Muriicola jejuensis]SMP01399.1 protein of unknown function [Muriicola jejuensis]